MARKFNITVNGTPYDVVVEELDGGVQAAPSPAQVAQPMAPAAAPVVAKPQPAAQSAASGEKVSSPMPGTIVAVKVSQGEKISKGQVLVVLEAMKMENDIVAPCDGTVVSLTVKKGDSVNPGDLIAVIG